MSASRISGDLEAPDADAKTAREQRDLEAQEAMALWSARMFWATAASVLLSGVGVVLIFLTFRESRRGAEAAELMAGEAAKSTLAAIKASDAAAKQAELSERMFEESVRTDQRAMRAYVRVSIPDGWKIVAGDLLRFPARVENYGKTAALNAYFHTEMQIGPLDHEWETDFEHVRNDHEAPKMPIDPQSNHPAEFSSHSSQGPVPQAAVDGIYAGVGKLMGRGILLYDDVYGERHETVITFYFGGRDCLRTNMLILTPGGNYAT